MKPGLLTTRYIPALLAVLSAAPCHAAGERVPIVIDQVSAALRAAALPTEDATLRMPARMSSSSATPALAIALVEPWGDRRARVRVACVDHAECLPFYVAVEWADAATAQAALAAVRARSGAPARSLIAGSSKPPVLPAPAAPAPAAAGATANAQFVRVENPFAAAKTASLPGPGGVRAGARATLLLTGSRIHIEVPVICLEAGAPGRSIRVAAADHKQNYVAEVVNPTLLKGTL